MLQRLKIFSGVIFIASMLILDVILTGYNNEIIKRNKELQAEIINVKIYYDQIGKVVIQALDLGLRGYALVPEEKLARPMQNAILWKDSIFQNVELPLQRLHFPLSQFRSLKDSINAYAQYCFNLKELLDRNDRVIFIERFRKDKGGKLWWQYLQCEKSIGHFADNINLDAERSYKYALMRNILLQIIIFCITVPMLFYTTKRTLDAFDLSKKLNAAEAEKNNTLSEQNARLEHEVEIRTKKLAAQNEEIKSQSEALSVHRDMLEQQVHKRTKELEDSNIELVANLNQVQQFSFTIAHIIRAPLANILGLTGIFNLVEEFEKDFLVSKIRLSALELDQVIRELNVILQINKHTGTLAMVDLNVTLKKVLDMLHREIDQTKTQIELIIDVSSIHVNGSYLESILYNLISNAIKFRDPDRTPQVVIRSMQLTDSVLLSVADNGLGIDLRKHEENIFGLFKRFHFHVEGRGLGLYLTRIQVLAMDGKIDVQSDPEKGTTFNIYFKNSRQIGDH
jgi:signal transduction histidine kinase